MTSDDIIAKGSVRNKASDIWAFGIIIWQLYTFSSPHSDYEGDNLIEAIRDGKKPGDIEDVKNDVLREIVQKCWNLVSGIEMKDIENILDDLVNKK